MNVNSPSWPVVTLVIFSISFVALLCLTLNDSYGTGGADMGLVRAQTPHPLESNSVALSSAAKFSTPDEFAEAAERSGSFIEPATNLDDQYLALYKNNLLAPAQKFKLANILEKCSRISARNIDELQRIERSPVATSDYIADYRKLFYSCDGIYDAIGDVSVKDLRLAWLESSADDGLSVAQLELLFEYPEPPLETEALLLLYGALQESNEDPTIKPKAFSLVYKFYRQYLEEKRSHDLDPVAGMPLSTPESYAWTLLACENNPDICDVGIFGTMLKDHLHGWEVEEMLKLRTGFSDSISREAWDELNLHSE